MPRQSARAAGPTCVHHQRQRRCPPRRCQVSRRVGRWIGRGGGGGVAGWAVAGATPPPCRRVRGDGGPVAPLSRARIVCRIGSGSSPARTLHIIRGWGRNGGWDRCGAVALPLRHGGGEGVGLVWGSSALTESSGMEKRNWYDLLVVAVGVPRPLSCTAQAARWRHSCPKGATQTPRWAVVSDHSSPLHGHEKEKHTPV